MNTAVGITTRNRSYILEICLRHFRAYMTPKTTIFVIDDSDFGSKEAETNMHLVKYFGFNYVGPTGVRRGIAGAKNACLQKMKTGFDHLFLFDDDCFPRSKDWVTCFTDCGVDHLCYSMDLRAFGDTPGQIQPTGQKLGNVNEFSAVLGCVMYMSQHVLKTVGYFDPRFGIYGYEHAQYTKRCHLAKHSPFLYSVPHGVRAHIFSIDMDFGWGGELPPRAKEFDSSLFHTSVTPEESAKHVDFAYLMNCDQIYIGEPT